MIIPTIDTELKELASSIRRFKDNDIDIIISDEPFVDKCRDKREIHCFFDEIGFERARDIDINKANYPIFVKPVDGSRSIGMSSSSYSFSYFIKQYFYQNQYSF